jgi:hypothetical protein
MVNDVTHTPIQLFGKGLTERQSRHFAEGEFKEFTNLIVTADGTLKKRDPVHGVGLFGPTVFSKFLGYREHRAVIEIWPGPYGSPGKTSGVVECVEPELGGGASGSATMETNLQAKSAFGAGTRQFGFEGFFQYNNRDHFIVWHGLNSSPNYPWKLYVASRATVTSGTQYPLDTYTIGDQIHSQTIFDPVEPTRPLPGPRLAGWMIHKDRLFIAVGDTVYFSKTADFLEWQIADDGGFFKFPGQTIKSITSTGDIVYVVFDNKISTITYSSGPNIDATVKTISETVGGEHAVSYQGIVYTYYDSSIYAISGNNVSLLTKLDIMYPIPYVTKSTDPTTAFNSRMKLAAYKNGLYILGQRMRFTEPENPNFYHLCNYQYTAPLSMYRLDLENGCLTKIEFEGEFSNVVCDIQSVPVEDSFNSPRLAIIAAPVTGTAELTFFFGSNKSIDLYTSAASSVENYVDIFGDYIDVGGASHMPGYVIPVKFQVSGFSPEGLKHYISKFRAILVQGDFPTVDITETPDTFDSSLWIPELQLDVQAGSNVYNFDGNNNLEATGLISAPLFDQYLEDGQVTVCKFGLNQRARALDIIIRTRDEVIGTPLYMTTAALGRYFATRAAMELVDLSVLWTKTKRGASNSPTDYS